MSTLAHACLGFLVAFQVMTPAMTQGRVRMCYFTNWAQKRTGIGRFTPANIDPALCTHIIYASAHISADGTTLTTTEPNDTDFYKQVVDLKRQNPALKVLLSVGGDSAEQSARFNFVASRELLTETFTTNAVAFLRKYGFDGLDVNWEFPDSNSRTAFQLFVGRLRIGFLNEVQSPGTEKLLIVVTVWGNHEEILNSYDPKNLVLFVDYFLLMTYNLWGTWVSKLGHQTGLYVRPQDVNDVELRRYTVSKTVNEWVNQGVSRDQLVLGFASYGLSTRLSDPTLHNIGDSYTRLPGTPGRLTATSGFLAYYEICENLADLSKGWTSFYVPVTEGAVAYSSQPPFDWVCYDNPQSFRAKAEYVVREGLAGAFFWTLDYDDFSGQACNNGAYPLLREVRAVFENQTSPFTTTTTAPTTTTKTTTFTSTATPVTTTTTPKSSRATTTSPTTRTTTTSPPSRTTTTTTEAPSSTARTTTNVLPSTTTTTTTSTTTTSTTITTTTRIPPSGTKACKEFACPVATTPTNPFHLYPDPYDCAYYYQCGAPGTYGSQIFHRKCPANLFFNPALLICDWQYNVNCVPCDPTNRTSG